MGGIGGLLGAGSQLASGYSTGRETKKYQRHEKKFVKRKYKYAIAQLSRGREAFKEESQRYEQRVQQALAGGRGVGFSSIAREEEERIRKARSRALKTYAERIDLAKRGYKLYRRGLKLQRKLAYINATAGAVSAAGAGLDAYLDRDQSTATGDQGGGGSTGGSDYGAGQSSYYA